MVPGCLVVFGCLSQSYTKPTGYRIRNVMAKSYLKYYITTKSYSTIAPMAASNNQEVYDRHFQTVQHTLERATSRLKLTKTEFLFVVSFVLNFLVGKVIHLTSQEEEVYNYYNDKRNVLNQIFVKKGWGWTTLAILIFYSLLFYGNQHPKAQTKFQRIQLVKRAVLNYVVATLWWVLFTQWCFGMPIMDKIFVWTGGKCTGVKHESASKHFAAPVLLKLFTKVGADGTEFDHIRYESRAITSYVCKKLQGAWSGGHDPSGHVFLLVHSSLYLFFETVHFARPGWPGWPGFGWSPANANQHAGTTSITQPNHQQHIPNFFTTIRDNPHLIPVGFISLWWFMLLMTNIYFHSIAEKLVGLLFAYFGIAVLYYLPRWV